MLIIPLYLEAIAIFQNRQTFTHVNHLLEFMWGKASNEFP